jgi:hypothetical protein
MMWEKRKNNTGLVKIDEDWPLLAKAQIESWRSLAYSAEARALKAEAALREIARIAKYGESDWGAIHFTTIANIARAALEGK